MDTTKEPTSISLPYDKNVTLITEVKKFPSLYDSTDPNYYILAERNRAWLEVAENCGEPADQCHLRWKSLRKRYAKERRKLPEILQGLHRPWALYPKMSFLAPPNTAPRRRTSQNGKPKSDPPASDLNTQASDDDMLIVGENNEIVRTCKSGEMSEDDEYIYETLDDPDSALEIMNKHFSKVKPTAIRSGQSMRATVTVPSRIGGSGRIRKLTPKMQNSFIAKKLKQAQQIMQQTNVPNNNNVSHKSQAMPQKVPSNNKTRVVKIEKPVPSHDKTRHIATVNPNIVRAEQIKENGNQSLLKTFLTTDLTTDINTTSKKEGANANKHFKLVKIKGTNPIIVSPEHFPEAQSFLKQDSSPSKEPSTTKSPVIKIKSVDNLNSSASNNVGETSNPNLDIIHSVGLMRKGSVEKPVKGNKNGHHSYSRAYSWNRPQARTVKPAAEKTHTRPELQTNHFEIEETWNDVKQEHVDDYWSQPQEVGYLPVEPLVMMETPESPDRTSWSNQVTEAKLELIAFQRRLMEEQHKKTLEFLKKEHDLKMTLLKAEIDLKRKQLNIML